MARTVAAQPALEVTLTTEQRIAQTEEEIDRRKAEADELEKQAAEIAMVDAEKSIGLDAKAVATRRYAERLESNLASLRKQEDAEEIARKEVAIDAAAAAELADVQAYVDRMKAIVPAVVNALGKLFAVERARESRNDPPTMAPVGFFQEWSGHGPLNSERAAIEVLDGLVQQMQMRLLRGAGQLKRDLRADATLLPRADTNLDVAAGAGRINQRLAAGGF